MKRMGDMLLRKGSFSEIVMGNTALVRAIVESGTRVVTSYPGSPTPEIAAAINRRISSAENIRSPFLLRFWRMTFAEGLLNWGPKRTGLSINPAS